MRPLFADRILQPVDQAWFDDPFTLGKGLDVITPVRKAWGETHIVISIAGGVCDRLEDRPICEVADNGTLATDLFNGGCEDPERVVFDRDASYAESHHLVPRKGTLATVCSRDFNKSIELNGPHTAETVSASPDLHCRRPMADIATNTLRYQEIAEACFQSLAVMFVRWRVLRAPGLAPTTENVTIRFP